MVEIKPITVYEWRVEWIRQQRNRPELMKYFRQNAPISYMDQKLWYMGLNTKKVKLWVITTGNPDPKVVGYVGLNPIDLVHCRAEFGIFVIPEDQGKGYATEAMKLLIKYVFEDLKLNKLYSDVFDYLGENRFDFYKDLKFKTEGRLRQHYFKSGQWVDSIQFSMLKEEYAKNKSVLEPRKPQLAGVGVE